jgi:hypothetical protein
MTKQCQKCERVCRDGSQFCSGCGGPLGAPAVTHKQLADYLANEILANYQSQRTSIGKSALFLVENRFFTFEHRIAQSMAEALNFAGLLPFDIEDSIPKQKGFVFFWSYLETLIEKKDLHEVYDAIVTLISAGRDVLIVCNRKEFVSSLFIDVSSATLVLPRFTPQTLTIACQVFFKNKKIFNEEDDLAWSRFLLPEDFLINSEVSDSPLRHIRESVLHRLSKYRFEDARDLDALYAYGEARDWAKDWSSDVREIIACSGNLTWNDIEHGALLVGRHGMGKTAFARSLAKASGINLLRIKMPDVDYDFDKAMEYLRDKWLEAKDLSPSILLIESGYKKIGILDFMFNEFDVAEPVFVLVTHLDEDVNESLLRAGRLERVLEIPFPTARILKDVYPPLLKSVGCLLTDKELDELSKNSQGTVRSLARAEEVVRLAQRAARRNGTSVGLQELMTQVYETPGSWNRVLPVKKIEDTAFHEAGHAVMMLLSSKAMKTLTYLSVVPKADYLGVTRSYFDEAEQDETRNDLIESIRIKLGGRAAEEIKNGIEGVSTGASSDLESATLLATVMSTRYGFGARQSLVSWEPDLAKNDVLREEVSSLLDEQYQVTLAKLKEHWPLVEQLVAAVMKKEEITGDEMREIYQMYYASLAIGKH